MYWDASSLRSSAKTFSTGNSCFPLPYLPQDMQDVDWQHHTVADRRFLHPTHLPHLHRFLSSLLHFSLFLLHLCETCGRCGRWFLKLSATAIVWDSSYYASCGRCGRGKRKSLRPNDLVEASGKYIQSGGDYFVKELAYCTSCIICRALSNLMPLSSMYFSSVSLWAE